jgi:hypothetical protein
MMSRMSSRWLGALALMTLAACSSDSTSGSEAASTTEVATTTSAATTSTLLPVPETSTSTTTTSTTTTSSTTSTTTTMSTTTTIVPTTAPPDPVADALVLSGAGIGATPFGSDPEEAIALVTQQLGEPTRDTEWIDPLSIVACPGEEFRIVAWDALELGFADESRFDSGRRHFSAYSYGVDGQIGVAPEGLVTTNGVGLGSSVADLRDAYPDVVLFEENDFDASNFYVNDNLRGYLTGVTDDAAVTVISGGDCGF